MRQFRKRLTYANVMSSIAVFLVIAGGSALAASQLAKNSVGSRQLKKNAVTAAKVKDNSLTGGDINESTLGIVPTAARADNSQALEGMSAAQLVNVSKPQCPAGTQLSVGTCVEKSLRPAATYQAAARSCAEAGRRLPLQGEAIVFGLQAYSSPQNYEWTEPLYIADGTISGTGVAAWTSGGVPSVNISASAAGGTLFYRCAIPPSS